MSIFFSYEAMDDTDDDIPEHQVEHLPDDDLIDWGQDAIDSGLWIVPPSPDYSEIIPLGPFEEVLNCSEKPKCVLDRVE